MSRPPIVVTGGLGFIGQHLVRALTLSGERVIVIDHRSPIEPLPCGVKSILLDVRDERELTRVLTIHAPERVFHLAALSGVRESAGRQEEYLSHNLDGTRSLHNAAASSGVMRALFASSSSVYGAARTLPTPEHAPTDPLSPYGRSKLAAEEFLLSRARSSEGPSWRIARLFTVYGPGARDGMAVPSFARALLNGSRVQINGSSETFRDFTHVADSVRGLLLLSQLEHTPGVVNIGTGERTTLKRLVALLEVLLQRKAETDSCPGDRLDPPGTHASIEKARALGYRPRVELMNGLRELLAQEQPSVVL